MSENAQSAGGLGAVREVGLSGRLGVQGDKALADMLAGEIRSSGGKVLIDMGAVDYVSSAGLRVLMIAYKQAEVAGKKVAMARVQPGVYKIFKLTASVALFHVFETRDDAIAWLNA